MPLISVLLLPIVAGFSVFSGVARLGNDTLVAACFGAAVCTVTLSILLTMIWIADQAGVPVGFG